MLRKKDRMRIANRNYRHKIEVWRLDGSKKNEIGEKVPNKEKVYDLWAEVIPVRGKEYVSVDKLLPEMQYKITTRYRADINQAMVIYWQGRELNIKAIVDISGKEEDMEIMCTEKVSIQKNVNATKSINLAHSQDIKVVLGFPASGKTTYVENNMTEDDMIVDLDKMVSAMTMKPMHSKEGSAYHATWVVNDLINNLVKNLKTNQYEYSTIFIIRTKLSDEQYKELHSLGAEFLWIDVDRNTCENRLISQGRTSVLSSLDSCEAFKEKYVDKIKLIRDGTNV